ncbi:MAG: CAP domain-containing protein [Acidimicrobiia bacterium]
MSVRRAHAVIFLVVAVLVAAGCRPKAAPAPPPPVVHQSSSATIQAVFNAHENLTGFDYQPDVGASMAAQWVANVNASSSACGPLLHSSGAQLLAWYPGGGGENLFCWYLPSGCATGQTAANAAVNAWIASPPHFSVMQQFRNRYLGVGASCRNGTTLFVVAHFRY